MSNLRQPFEKSPHNKPKKSPTPPAPPPLTSSSSSDRTNIEVLVRIRPATPKEIGETPSRIIIKPIDPNNLLFDPKDSSKSAYIQGLKHKIRVDFTKKPNKDIIFAFDRVYGPQTSNFQIFQESLKKVVGSLIEGFNCSCFAYGATGAGKSFTMLGSIEVPGMCFYVAMELFGRINEMSEEYESEVVVSFVEIYNETLRDLLHPSESLSIQEDNVNGVIIPNLTMHKPKDATELLSMLTYGNSLRTSHPTEQNQTSSRSHAIFQILVSLRRRYTQDSYKPKMIRTKLLMVDLAGSERGCSSLSDGPRFREGSSINKSLLALGNVINALADGKKHIPYRDSKLTRLMKDSIGGNCRTVMIACMSPNLGSYDETYNTLKYAERVKEIKVTLKRNFCNMDDHSSYLTIIGDLKGEVERLKKELRVQKEMEKSPPNPFSYPSAIKKSRDIRDTLLCPDPSALDTFIKLLELKKKYEEEHLAACVKARECSWQRKWIKWRIAIGSSFQTDGLLKELKNSFESHSKALRTARERARLSRTILDFNEKEIENAIEGFLVKTKLENPFMMVTLKEFLYYKSLEREISIHRQVVGHNKRLSLNILQQLVDQEGILLSSFDLLDRVHSKKPGQQRELNRRYEKELLELKSAFLGDVKTTQLRRSWLQVEKLLMDDVGRLVKKPVNEYESDNSDEEELNLDNLMRKMEEIKGNALKWGVNSGKGQNQGKKIGRTISPPLMTIRYRNKATMEVGSSSLTDLGEPEIQIPSNPPSVKVRRRKLTQNRVCKSNIKGRPRRLRIGKRDEDREEDIEEILSPADIKESNSGELSNSNTDELHAGGGGEGGEQDHNNKERIVQGPSGKNSSSQVGARAQNKSLVINKVGDYKTMEKEDKRPKTMVSNSNRNEGKKLPEEEKARKAPLNSFGSNLKPVGNTLPPEPPPLKQETSTLRTLESLDNLPKPKSLSSRLNLFRFRRKSDPGRTPRPFPSKTKPTTDLQAELERNLTPFSSVSSSSRSKKGSPLETCLSSSSSSQVLGCMSLPELGGHPFDPTQKCTTKKGSLGKKRKALESTEDEEGGGGGGGCGDPEHINLLKGSVGCTCMPEGGGGSPRGVVPIKAESNHFNPADNQRLDLDLDLRLSPVPPGFE